MDPHRRYRGFVIGSDPGPTGIIWKVRVKDPDYEPNGQKLIVASVHGNITLAKGLNVNFLIGNVDDEHGSPVLRAVDVQLS